MNASYLNLRQNGFLLLPRQSTTCSAGRVADEAQCVPQGSCQGASFPNQCGTGTECCFYQDCKVSNGNGWCKNETHDVCDGDFYTGDALKPPCTGPNEMRCCVNYADMLNGTSPSPSQAPTNNNGLTGPEIGGVVGGIIGAIALGMLIFLIVFLVRRWKKKQREQVNPQVNPLIPPPTTTTDPVGTTSELDGKDGRHEVDGKGVGELDGRGQEVLEMEGSGTGTTGATGLSGQRVELPAFDLRR